MISNKNYKENIFGEYFSSVYQNSMTSGNPTFIENVEKLISELYEGEHSGLI